MMPMMSMWTLVGWGGWPWAAFGRAVVVEFQSLNCAPSCVQSYSTSLDTKHPPGYSHSFTKNAQKTWVETLEENNKERGKKRGKKICHEKISFAFGVKRKKKTMRNSNRMHGIKCPIERKRKAKEKKSWNQHTSHRVLLVSHLIFSNQHTVPSQSVGIWGSKAKWFMQRISSRQKTPLRPKSYPWHPAVSRFFGSF